MSEILKEYDKEQKKFKKKYSFLEILKYIGVVCCVILFGIYIGNMLFGKRSLDVMLSLQNKKENLIKDVEYLKKENSRLQKEYFELKDLESDVSKK
ncbi:septum formation initiator [Campylobacter pinnipediorum]|uniref:Septum formation initiator n=1 Tax=Campylobacter pinnipediorum subsp. pinnipediorum TaxID=1660067 RepID=A0AAX0L8Z0_9BACT|nr:septum formation initiator [Campylobacter pinnipediorum]AQW83567.1 hypothetical protein CPIN17261_1578 [Campylobacter pinnipediorum subsp. pinnipediorum]AQW85089.1 hypothetical protein CPIN17262_1424 [Campylobacter pinnipediorum subsp. pinnipediorum]OPA75939.1 septum formation initiator [Campylobacter pinnipediorum subsp. pinnipediorum]OPA75952.1 septum formation initiator [Campylobacter pinnipediorum subsp. pinnipediorum]